MSTIQEFYKEAEREDKRLLTFCRVEYEITKRAILDHLPNRSGLRILDIGGATGNYAFWLESRGHQVTLVDREASHIEFAQEKLARLGSSVTAAVGDAVDLSRFGDRTFEIALSLGPQYHLTDPDDLTTSLNELKRVVIPRGLVFAAFLNKMGTLRWWWNNRPDVVLERIDFFRSFATTGHFPEVDFSGFNNYVALEPDSIRQLMTSQGLAEVAMYNCEGIGGRINAEGASEEEIRQLTDFAYQFCSEEKYLILAEHLLYVGNTPS